MHRVLVAHRKANEVAAGVMTRHLHRVLLGRDRNRAQPDETAVVRLRVLVVFEERNRHRRVIDLGDQRKVLTAEVLQRLHEGGIHRRRPERRLAAPTTERLRHLRRTKRPEPDLEVSRGRRIEEVGGEIGERLDQRRWQRRPEVVEVEQVVALVLLRPGRGGILDLFGHACRVERTEWRLPTGGARHPGLMIDVGGEIVDRQGSKRGIATERVGHGGLNRIDRRRAKIGDRDAEIENDLVGEGRHLGLHGVGVISIDDVRDGVERDLVVGPGASVGRQRAHPGAIAAGRRQRGGRRPGIAKPGDRHELGFGREEAGDADAPSVPDRSLERSRKDEGAVTTDHIVDLRR